MSFGSSHEFKEQVRQATDLVDLVSRSIQLRRQGRNYVGLCPWHDDARPSLQVNPERQQWKCWVCDVGGDVFSFTMRREGVDFPEAIRMLAERAGIPLPNAGHKKAVPGSADDKQTLYQAMAWAEEQFHHCLLEAPQAEPARSYLRDRGISDESIRRFHLGYSPDGWQWLLDRARTTRFSPAILDAAGLLGKTKDGQRFYDRFRGRLLFSIRDTEHRPIAFGGRVLPGTSSAESGAKYVNSPETRLFTKSNHLYALDVVRDVVSREPHIVVVEGYTDVIMAHQHGVNNVVAALGTALGERHVRLLQRFADTITLVLDGDEAGQRRTNEVLELFVAAQVDLRILTLPAGLDPCDFIAQRGKDAFLDLLNESVDALEHKFRTVTKGVNLLEDTDGAHKALEDILRTLAAAPRISGVTAESLRLREQQMLVRLARQFHVQDDALRARLKALRSAKTTTSGATPLATERQVGLSPAELELFEILLAHPELAEQALTSLDLHDMTTAQAKELWGLFLQAQQLGRECTCEDILTIAETVELKSLIVRLHEQACRKAPHALMTADKRLEGLVDDVLMTKQRSTQRKMLATLEKQGYDEKEELAVLERMIQQERDRQGISAPTDG